MKKLVNILLVCIALVFTILSGSIVPKKQFEQYNLVLDSVWRKEAKEQEYMVEINNDSKPEFLLHHNINQSGHSLEFRQNNTVHEIYIFKGNEIFASRFLYFAQINRKHTNGIIFITVKERIAYLNILEYNSKKRILLPVEKVKIDSVSFFNGAPDVVNNSIIASQSEIYFDLQSGYSIQPRNIYKYDLKSKTLLKTKRNSLVCTKLQYLSFNKQKYILACNVKATGNTVSPKESESMKNSKNADTLSYYQETKHLVYPYGDFSSYILLYDNKLDFAFEPIEFNGWTNYTKSEIINIDSIPHIVSLTNTEKGQKSDKLITVSNLKGNIVRQTPLPSNFTDLFVRNSEIVFFGNNSIFQFSEKLEPKSSIKNISFASGFLDTNHDNEKEFIAFDKNTLIVFSGNFKHSTTFKIEQEFAPYPEENGISILEVNGKSCFLYNTRLFYYLFSYSKNNFAFLRYPFYLLVFAFWLSLLNAVVKINSKRLEKEKKQLEETVAERTVELKEKNQRLNTQKSEIQTQAKELSRQNKHLEELDRFKRTLTGTLVHDLKNPLGQILFTSKDKTVNNLARRMLLLITNMLDVDKYEQTEFKINKETHSLNDILVEAIEGIEVSLLEKNITLKLNMDNVAVEVDKELIVRVFENLLSNAIRFSPQNQNIEIDANYTEFQNVEISIKNYGENIPDEAIESIFDKYIQAHKIESSSYKSTGLGLTFCKMVLQAHNQNIKAENLDGGVLFRFSLDGQRLSQQKIINPTNYSPIELTLTEKELLRPWLEQLKTFEIYQISDIIEILDQIPNSSENIIALKQQITNAVFASNAELYSQIIC